MKVISIAVQAAVVAGCASATTPAAPEKEAEAKPASPVEAPNPDEVQTAPAEPTVPIELVTVSASTTDHQPPRLRWTGTVRVTDELADRTHLLGKTSCAAGDVALSNMMYGSVNDATASMGDPPVGSVLEFSVDADPRASTADGPCELALHLLDGTNKRSPAASTRACFSAGEATIGACEPALPRATKRQWALHGFAFDSESRRARFVVQVGATLRPTGDVVLKTKCLHERPNTPAVVVRTTRTFNSWGLHDSSDAVEADAYVDDRTFAGAKWCQFEVHGIGHATSGIPEPTQTQLIGQRCWHPGRGTHRCVEPMLVPHVDSEQGARLTGVTVNVAGGRSPEVGVNAFLTAHERLPAGTRLRTVAYCDKSGVRQCELAYRGPDETLVAPLEPGESVPIATSRDGYTSRPHRIAVGYVPDPDGDPVWLAHYCPPKTGTLWSPCER